VKFERRTIAKKFYFSVVAENETDDGLIYNITLSLTLRRHDYEIIIMKKDLKKDGHIL